MIQIEHWFPIYIGYAHIPFHKEIEKELTELCLERKKSAKEDYEKFRKEKKETIPGSPTREWYGYQQNTSYQILKDQKFSRLHNWIDVQVKEVAESVSLSKEIYCAQGWFNSYEKYDYTEYHNHSPSIFSCVYFLNCEEETGAKLLIKNNNDSGGLANICKTPALTPVVSFMYHNPFPGKLVIFPSYLDHAVQQKNTDNLRMTLAYNYNLVSEKEKKITIH